MRLGGYTYSQVEILKSKAAGHVEILKSKAAETQS